MKKHHVGLSIDTNSFQDEGDGIISFPSGLTITDDSPQRNNTRYDVNSLDLTEYSGQVTADHVDKLDSVIGKVNNIRKEGSKVVVDSIRFAVKENPLARLAYNLFKGGFLTDFSTETYGPPADESGVYHNSSLIGLSAVVVGNNRNAKASEIVFNSIEQSKKDGLDTSILESNFVKDDDTSAKVSNEVDKSNIKVNKKEKETMSKIVEDDKKVVEKEVNKVEKKETVVNKVEVDANAITEAVKAAMAPLAEQVAKLEQNAFDKNVEEPAFKKDANGIKSKNGFDAMDWRERHALQINSAWDVLKRHDSSAAETLNKINEANLNDLKKEGVVSNALSITDFGNFVISRELLSEIEGCRNDYTPLIKATSWKETLSTQFAWLKRSGDISMSAVDFETDGANSKKPLSEYTASINTSDLEELAAVTPVCNAATRFLAVDLLGDVAAGYRNDYDRKRAQLVVARLEQAVETNGNSVIYDTNPSVEAIVSLLNAWKEIATCTPNGTFVMNSTSYASILAYALRAGVSGPLSQIFTTGNVPTMFGRPYIVVSDDLMPSLDSAGTVSITVDGAAVTVNHAVFYGNLNNFTGRTSGGLQYDLSTEAAYDDGVSVKSAYQRNELVLRGSFFRGGAIKDVDQVAGILSPGVS